MHSPERDEAVLAAETLLARFLAERDAPETADVEVLCRLHPDRAVELRRLFVEQRDGQLLIDAAGGIGLGLESPTLATVRVGSRVGLFQLEHPLGGGAMGEVWQARHARSGSVVALKLMHKQLASNPRAVLRFRREAEAGKRLDHANIARVEDAGVASGRLYIAQELVEGGRTVGDWLRAAPRQARLPRKHFIETARIAGCVAQALHHAHEHGIVHRDVKPQNILLDPQGCPKVADFGLALVHDAFSVSQSGEITGTAAYMSPEHVRAGPAAVDRRSDVFSLGAVLYEMLTLKRPFDGAGLFETMRNVLNRAPERPRSLRAEIPAGLEAVCLQAIEKDPSKRFQSMEDFALALETASAALGYGVAQAPAWWTGFRPGALRSSLRKRVAVAHDVWDAGRRSRIARWTVAAGLTVIAGLVWLPLRTIGAAAPEGGSTGQPAHAELSRAASVSDASRPAVANEPPRATRTSARERAQLLSAAEAEYAHQLDLVRARMLSELRRDSERFEAGRSSSDKREARRRRDAYNRFVEHDELPAPELISAELLGALAEARAALRAVYLRLANDVDEGMPSANTEESRELARRQQVLRLDRAGLYERMRALPRPQFAANVGARGGTNGKWIRTSEGISWSGETPTDAGVILIGDTSWTDYDVTVRGVIDPLSPTEFNVLACVEGEQCWAFNAGGLGIDNRDLRPWVDGQDWWELPERRFTRRSRTTHPGDEFEMLLRVRGATIATYCEGRLIARSSHPALTHGRVGFNSKDATVFTEIEVRAPDGSILWKGLPLELFSAAMEELSADTRRAASVPPSARTSLNWADTLERFPDPMVVPQPEWRSKIEATGLPWRVRDRASGIELLLVPAGTYQRGAASDDGAAELNETPPHAVTITRPFYLGRYEVQVEEWNSVMAGTPSTRVALGMPCQGRTCSQVQEFLSRSPNLRLPTEGEWELAARAGTTKALYGTRCEIAWAPSCSDGVAHIVGQKAANALGFHDMIGNVWEMCSDEYDPDEYTRCIAGVTDPSGPTAHSACVLRGGSYNANYTDTQCRASIRGYQERAGRGYNTRGFRVARDP